MSDMLKAIHNDTEEYKRLCQKYKEAPVMLPGGLDADCYGSHAMKLKRREQEENMNC